MKRRDAHCHRVKWSIDDSIKTLIREKNLYIKQEAFVRLEDVDSNPMRSDRDAHCHRYYSTCRNTDENGHRGRNFSLRKMLQSIRFADDQAMVSDTKTGLQRIMDRLSATAEEYGMKINTKKTKVMTIL